MATKFSSLIETPKIETFFTAGVEFDQKSNKGRIEVTSLKPTDYEEVVWLGYDRFYGDVFKAISRDGYMTIFFGKKGNEFN